MIKLSLATFVLVTAALIGCAADSEDDHQEEVRVGVDVNGGATPASGVIVQHPGQGVVPQSGVVGQQPRPGSGVVIQSIHPGSGIIGQAAPGSGVILDDK